MKRYKIKVDSKDVYLSRTGDNFRVIKPVKNDDGSINWFNLLTGGSWTNLIIVAVIVMIIVGLAYEYMGNIQMFLDCFNIPGQLNVCQKAFGPEPIMSYAFP